MITCIDCGEEVKRKSNVQKRCTECAKEARRKRDREYYAKNLKGCREYHAKNREKGREYYAENREAARIRRRKNYLSNRPQESATRARYHDKNHESILERQAAYYAENREAARERNRRRRQENPKLSSKGNRIAKERDSAVSANRSRSPWTAAEDAVVMSWAEGDRELGAVLGRTRSSAGQRRRYLLKRSAEQSVSSKEQP